MRLSWAVRAVSQMKGEFSRDASHALTTFKYFNMYHRHQYNEGFEGMGFVWYSKTISQYRTDTLCGKLIPSDECKNSCRCILYHLLSSIEANVGGTALRRLSSPSKIKLPSTCTVCSWMTGIIVPRTERQPPSQMQPHLQTSGCNIQVLSPELEVLLLDPYYAVLSRCESRTVDSALLVCDDR